MIKKEEASTNVRKSKNLVLQEAERRRMILQGSYECIDPTKELNPLKAQNRREKI